MDNWFTIDKIDEQTYIFSEYRHWEETHCYLLNGNERSLLIDTGLGIENIYNEIITYTNKPITAVATHIHWDHIGGHKYFPDFYAHSEELDWLNGKFPLSIETIREMVIDRCDLPDGFDGKENNMITRLKYGKTNTFFIYGTNCGLLIDTDYAGTLLNFYKSLKKNNISITDITYILATHYHPDHIGIVSELTKFGIKLLLVDSQCDYVHFADYIFMRERHLRYEPIDEKNAVIITCKESRDFLAKMGIEGEIIQTTSHSKDSISIILDNGECIVGDLEPMEYLDAYEENVDLESDWKRVMSYNPKIIYYSHANKKHFL